MSAVSYPLAMAREGERLVIARLEGGRRMDLRLTEMGLNTGSEISVAQRMGHQMVVVRGTTRLALGAGMAMKIWVRPAGA